MESAEIRRKFLKFFEERGHVVMPSSSLIPDDPSVLFTTAGMQQFKKYYTGELDARKDFRLSDGTPAKGIVSIQKCFRTSDIDEVGDASHLTFFEMLGNFSFGGYGKKEAIRYAHEFITKEMELAIDYVSVFEGDRDVPADEESEKMWKLLDPKIKIERHGREDNFWGPTGPEGPCGPTVEIYVKNGTGKSIEVWNLVFNQCYRHADGRLAPLKTLGIDTGMGLERLAMVVQKAPTIFETDLFARVMQTLPAGISPMEKRIIGDHSRGIVFLVADCVRPSNKGVGYVLRRLLRRLLRYEGEKVISKELFENLATSMSDYYGRFYGGLDGREVLEVIKAEREKFSTNLKSATKNFIKIAGEYDLYSGSPTEMVWRKKYQNATIASFIFKMYESCGSPFEMTVDMLRPHMEDFNEDNLKAVRTLFDERFKKHQEISRAGAEKKFGGHGLVLDTGELKAGSEEEMKKVLRLHTATHLLQQALREVLGPEVHQMGSDITPLRTRFDFSFPRKMTPEEVKKTEEIVNQKIKEDLPVGFKEMPKNEAEKLGALHFFKEKYPERVKVYYVGRDFTHAWSKEFCGGPHVAHTGEIGHFRIVKEEAVGAGIRRIRGTLDN